MNAARQRSVEPRITAPVVLVFAGDHGVADRGVSASPREVTRQMVRNWVRWVRWASATRATLAATLARGARRHGGW